MIKKFILAALLLVIFSLGSIHVSRAEPLGELEKVLWRNGWSSGNNWFPRTRLPRIAIDRISSQDFIPWRESNIPVALTGCAPHDETVRNKIENYSSEFATEMYFPSEFRLVSDNGRGALSLLDALQTVPRATFRIGPANWHNQYRTDDECGKTSCIGWSCRGLFRVYTDRYLEFCVTKECNESFRRISIAETGKYHDYIRSYIPNLPEGHEAGRGRVMEYIRVSDTGMLLRHDCDIGYLEGTSITPYYEQLYFDICAIHSMGYIGYIDPETFHDFGTEEAALKPQAERALIEMHKARP